MHFSASAAAGITAACQRVAGRVTGNGRGTQLGDQDVSIQKNRPAFVTVDVISLQHIAFFRVFLYNKKKIRECGDEEVADSAAG